MKLIVDRGQVKGSVPWNEPCTSYTEAIDFLISGASLDVRSRGAVHHGSKHRLCVAVVGGSGRASRARAKGICKRADR